MIGIYSYENKINHKRYIGQSRNLQNRYNQHLNSYCNINSSMYNTQFYRALRKYGMQNFNYSILFSTEESIDQNQLNLLEEYYIKLYESFGPKGYNMNKGGRFTSSQKVLNESQAQEIQQLLISSEQTFEEIANKYQISVSLVGQINSGGIWNYDSSLKYPLRSNSYSHNIGGKNPNAIFLDSEVLEMRQRYVNENLKTIYNDYKDRCSYSALKKILYGVSYQHLPIYKKYKKHWELNGTCIDQFRLET